jgi:anthranilate 1,2-dioxygenase small subunit/terephthalate 1,2-dioxygenase oxygenase component beta subunit
MNIEQQLRVQDLNARYVEAIDDDKLESWPDFFAENGSYRITTAENVAHGFPISLMYATSRAMLRDRVKALRQANIYEAQRYRHIIAMPRLYEADGGTVRARTHFLVVRIMHSGESMVFATGQYEDRVVFDNDRSLFADRLVIIDSKQIDTLMAIPL